MARIGAHLHDGDPLPVATAMGVNAVQFFLGDPQDWKAPTMPGGRDPDQIRAEFAAADVVAYVHAPYLVNVASPIGAAGLIVHGGHVTADTDPAEGYVSWRKAIERIERPLPMLIENTAGGDGAMARSLENIARLWEAIGAAGGDDVGFCLDTCHANSAGEDLVGIVDRVKAITGRIDLVHCNNSRDEFNSGRDRHAGLTSGTIESSVIVSVVQAAGSPVICETPDPAADVR